MKEDVLFLETSDDIRDMRWFQEEPLWSVTAPRFNNLSFFLSPAVCRRCPNYTQVHQGPQRHLLPSLPADSRPAQSLHLPPTVHPGRPSQIGVWAPEQNVPTSELRLPRSSAAQKIRRSVCCSRGLPATHRYCILLMSPHELDFYFIFMKTLNLKLFQHLGILLLFKSMLLCQKWLLWNFVFLNWRNKMCDHQGAPVV